MLGQMVGTEQEAGVSPTARLLAHWLKVTILDYWSSDPDRAARAREAVHSDWLDWIAESLGHNGSLLRERIVNNEINRGSLRWSRMSGN